MNMLSIWRKATALTFLVWLHPLSRNPSVTLRIEDPMEIFRLGKALDQVWDEVSGNLFIQKPAYEMVDSTTAK